MLDTYIIAKIRQLRYHPEWTTIYRFHCIFLYVFSVHHDQMALYCQLRSVLLLSAIISEHNHPLKSCSSCMYFSPSLSSVKTLRAYCGNEKPRSLFFLNHTHLHITIPIHKNPSNRLQVHAQYLTTHEHSF